LVGPSACILGSWIRRPAPPLPAVRRLWSVPPAASARRPAADGSAVWPTNRCNSSASNTCSVSERSPRIRREGAGVSLTTVGGGQDLVVLGLLGVGQDIDDFHLAAVAQLPITDAAQVIDGAQGTRRLTCIWHFAKLVWG